MRLALILAAVAAISCVDIPGTTEGEPCNSRGFCGSGLICDDGICRSEQSGSSWEVMRTPFESAINAVWARSDSEVYAVGAEGRIYRHEGSGLDWTEDKHGLTTKTLHAVWGDDGQIIAAGAGVILRHDGSGWAEEQVHDSTKTAPADLLASYTIYSIHGNANATYAAGSRSYSDGLVLKRGSSDWQTVEEAELTYAAHGLWLAGDKLYVVGDAKHVRLLDGATWGAQNLTEKIALKAIWGIGATLIAVGPAKMMLRFDGSWQQLSDARAGYAANAIWGASDTEYYVVGTGSGYGSSFSAIEKCSKERCVTNMLPEAAQGKQLHGIWGTKSMLYAVGASGMILQRKR